jgi:hypothetical protein
MVVGFGKGLCWVGIFSFNILSWSLVEVIGFFFGMTSWCGDDPPQILVSGDVFLFFQ